MIQPKLIQLKNAPAYLGMNKNMFYSLVKPHLTEIRIGRTVRYDRVDLDAWADNYKRDNGLPASEDTCKKYQDSTIKTASGLSTRKSINAEFIKSVETVAKGRRKQS